MRGLLNLITGAVLVAVLGAGQGLAQPASTSGVGAETGAGQGVKFTVGAGVGMAPDYEGSNDYELVPLWNLTAVNLYHPKTYIQLLGPRLRSNFLPDDHWQLGLSGQFIKERKDVDDNAVDDLESVDASLLLGVIGGYEDGGTTPDVSYSPYFGDAVQALYRRAIATGA